MTLTVSLPAAWLWALWREHSELGARLCQCPFIWSVSETSRAERTGPEDLRCHGLGGGWCARRMGTTCPTLARPARLGGARAVAGALKPACSTRPLGSLADDTVASVTAASPSGLSPSTPPQAAPLWPSEPLSQGKEAQPLPYVDVYAEEGFGHLLTRPP